MDKISYEIVQNQPRINFWIGEGIASARARLTFNQWGELIGRRAHHSVFDEDIWEETEYSVPARKSNQ